MACEDVNNLHRRSVAVALESARSAVPRARGDLVGTVVFRVDGLERLALFECEPVGLLDAWSRRDR